MHESAHASARDILQLPNPIFPSEEQVDEFSIVCEAFFAGVMTIHRSGQHPC